MVRPFLVVALLLRFSTASAKNERSFLWDWQEKESDAIAKRGEPASEQFPVTGWDWPDKAKWRVGKWTIAQRKGGQVRSGAASAEGNVQGGCRSWK